MKCALLAAAVAAAALPATFAGTPSDAAAPRSAIDLALESARAAHHPVMMDFSAEWCAACRLLDRRTLADSTVVEESRRFVTLRVDMSNDDEPTKELERRFGVATLPTVVFVDSRGGMLNSHRVTGFVEPKAFVETMRSVR